MATAQSPSIVSHVKNSLEWDMCVDINMYCTHIYGIYMHLYNIYYIFIY